MTPQFILRRSLCRPAHCYSAHVPGHGYVNRGDDPATKADYDRQRLRSAETAIDNLQWANGYAEPGYQDPAKGILFADWNIFARGIDSILERYGYELEWEDEWSTCGDCGKAVRTSGNSYHWQPHYVIMNECELVCLECVDWPAYLESIEDDPRSACMAECDPSDHGYRRISDRNEYENGFHPGQNDDPAKILKALQDRGHSGIVFRLSETSQFYVRFEVYEREETEETE